MPADAEQILHDRGRGDDPFLLEDLARVAKRIGLTARVRQVALPDIAKLPLPVLAETSDGDSVILLKVEDASLNPRYLVQRGDAERPEIWDRDGVGARLSGRILLLTSREKMVGDTRPFDIAWFIPALVRYRGPLRDVLIASFFLQLMGLVSPIQFIGRKPPKEPTWIEFCLNEVSIFST